MADKTIGELPAATQVNADDLFILEQSSAAKKLTGQALESWLLSVADGHGGIQNVAKTGTSGLVDTYTITYADASTSSFTVTNGARGATGPSDRLWIKYASRNPQQDSDMGDIPSSWIGVAVAQTIAAPLHFTSYTWYKWGGQSGPIGVSIDSVSKISGTGAAGTSDTYSVLLGDGTSAGTFQVYNGADGGGGGTVKSINNISPAANGNLTLAAEDFNAVSISSIATENIQISVTVGANSVGLGANTLQVTPGSFVCFGVVGVTQDMDSMGKVVLCSYGANDDGDDVIYANITVANLTAASVTATFTLKCLRILQYT